MPLGNDLKGNKKYTEKNKIWYKSELKILIKIYLLKSGLCERIFQIKFLK